MFNEDNIHTVIVHWSYPIRIENIDRSPYKDCEGIYYISRQFGLYPEKVIYIGETKRTFHKRLEEEKKREIPWTRKGDRNM